MTEAIFPFPFLVSESAGQFKPPDGRVTTMGPTKVSPHFEATTCGISALDLLDLRLQFIFLANFRRGDAEAEMIGA